jgi:hypothetical protein
MVNHLGISMYICRLWTAVLPCVKNQNRLEIASYRGPRSGIILFDGNNQAKIIFLNLKFRQLSNEKLSSRQGLVCLLPLSYVEEMVKQKDEHRCMPKNSTTLYVKSKKLVL